MNGIISAELGGKVRSIRFGMLAFETLLMTSSESDKKVKSTAKIIHAGLINAAEVNGVELDCTFMDVYGWVDELFCTPDGNKILQDIEKCFEDSSLYQNVLKPLVDKKKAEAEKPKKNQKK